MQQVSAWFFVSHRKQYYDSISFDNQWAYATGQSTAQEFSYENALSSSSFYIDE